MTIPRALGTMLLALTLTVQPAGRVGAASGVLRKEAASQSSAQRALLEARMSPSGRRDLLRHALLLVAAAATLGHPWLTTPSEGAAEGLTSSQQLDQLVVNFRLDEYFRLFRLGDRDSPVYFLTVRNLNAMDHLCMRLLAYAEKETTQTAVFDDEQLAQRWALIGLGYTRLTHAAFSLKTIAAFRNEAVKRGIRLTREEEALLKRLVDEGLLEVQTDGTVQAASRWPRDGVVVAIPQGVEILAGGDQEAKSKLRRWAVSRALSQALYHAFNGYMRHAHHIWSLQRPPVRREFVTAFLVASGRYNPDDEDLMENQTMAYFSEPEAVLFQLKRWQDQATKGQLHPFELEQWATIQRLAYRDGQLTEEWERWIRRLGAQLQEIRTYFFDAIPGFEMRPKPKPSGLIAEVGGGGVTTKDFPRRGLLGVFLFQLHQRTLPLEQAL